MNENQSIDIELEMNKIVLAGMTGETELRDSISSLVSHYEVVDKSPIPMDIAKEMQKLTVEYMGGSLSDEQRDNLLYGILMRALTAKEKIEVLSVVDSTQATS